MRKILITVLLLASGQLLADLYYKNYLEFPTNTLEFTTDEIARATERALTGLGWQVENKSEKRVIGNLQGGRSRVEISFPTTDSIKFQYLTKHDMENYKFYRRLLYLRANILLYLSDCGNPALQRDKSQTSPELLVRRNAVFALAKLHWNIKSISESRIVSSLPARGRMEIELSGSATPIIRHWDEIEEEYVSDDGYVRRVRNIYTSQTNRCR